MPKITQTRAGATVWLAAALWACAAYAADRSCENDIALVDTHFEGGVFDRCVVRDGNFVITIRPEDNRVRVPMPWYAFRISPKKPGVAVFLVGFVGGDADRFWPKVSADGNSWQRLPESIVAMSDDASRLAMRIPLRDTPLWIASQQLLTTAHYDERIRQLATHPELTVRTLGASLRGRPLYVAETEARTEGVLLIGRQHPPEVTGALTMRAFVDTVLAETELAGTFRDRFALAVVPLVNPDGVAAGHWRHNAGKTDLNRDWGPFRQPETRHIRDLLDALDDDGIALRLMLDFHATQATDNALFYTQRAADGDGSAHAFAADWLGRVRDRLPDIEFDHRPSKSETANAKNYFYNRYRIPSITYESGDETDPAWIDRATPVFAEEMMNVLLNAP